MTDRLPDMNGGGAGNGDNVSGTGLVYFLTFIFVLLYLTARVIDRRRWRSA